MTITENSFRAQLTVDADSLHRRGNDNLIHVTPRIKTEGLLGISRSSAFCQHIVIVYIYSWCDMNNVR